MFIYYKTIRIRRDDFILKSLKNPWHEVINEFSLKIDELTKPNVANTFQASFSTTTKVSQIASQIILMDSMQKYFEYQFCTRCGVPEIRVSGTREDWLSVEVKTKKIVSLIPELSKWMDNGLNDILQQFINIFDEKIDKAFWNVIYKCIYMIYYLYFSLVKISLFYFILIFLRCRK